MFLAGVKLVALGVLFLLTALALWASGQLGHPVRVAALLAVVLGGGVVLIFFA